MLEPPPDVSLDAIRARLAAREPHRFPGPAERHAAVAAILRVRDHEPDVLLIRRAERVGDPWSGHMAFPGGHREPQDPDLLATARRETLEEIGLDLAPHELLGQLDEHPATARGTFTGMVIAPFVFAVTGDLAFRPNHEVASVTWAPLGRMARGELDTVYELEHAGDRLRLPAYGVGDNRVWGLTHRMLQNLFDSLR